MGARVRYVLLLPVFLLASIGRKPAGAEVIQLVAKDTLTAVEMNHGDELKFQLQCGRLLSLALEDTGAAIVEEVRPGGIVYRFAARVRIDGQPMTLERYVCSQQCFYEPWVVNGLRIWLDTVKPVFDLVPIRYPRKGNLQCLPRKDARFALQDATLRICPDWMSPWIQHEQDCLDAGACYNGDDCYLGPYLGQACHVGMDINHPKGSLLFAPIGFDTQAYFNSLAMGHNNNRWRAIRRWPNGDVWALQTHHLINLLVPENAPVNAGSKYATTAGVHVGSHQHTHFEFKVGRPRGSSQLLDAAAEGKRRRSVAFPIDFDDESQLAQTRPEVLHLDPWILFWQIFEDRKARRGEIRAWIKPVGPARTGQPVTFSAHPAQPGPRGMPVEYAWAFGDGGCARGVEVDHVFAQAGVYPVTLTADDGARRASRTHHITISGHPVQAPVLGLSAPQEPSFRPRPVMAVDVYGRPPQCVPHTLDYVARSSRPVPCAKVVELRNLGGGELPDAGSPGIDYQSGTGWLKIVARGSGNRQSLEVTADAAGLEPGRYGAKIWVDCAGVLNSPQPVLAELRVPTDPGRPEVTIDDGDPGFYATPYFWVGHRFCRCPPGKRGHGGFYLTNGWRPRQGEFVRFTPDLEAGRHEVALSPDTPYSGDAEFDVRVRHKQGEQIVRIKPRQSRVIGVFPFDEGTDGFLEIHAGNSKGLVIADAVLFRRQ